MTRPIAGTIAAAALQSINLRGLKGAIFTNKDDISVSAMSEASKCLNDIGYISRSEVVDSEFCLREGFEYLIG